MDSLFGTSGARSQTCLGLRPIEPTLHLGATPLMLGQTIPSTVEIIARPDLGLQEIPIGEPPGKGQVLVALDTEERIQAITWSLPDSSAFERQRADFLNRYGTPACTSLSAHENQTGGIWQDSATILRVLFATDRSTPSGLIVLEKVRQPR